jgi:hypothetical protein
MSSYVIPSNALEDHTILYTVLGTVIPRVRPTFYELPRDLIECSDLDLRETNEGDYDILEPSVKATLDLGMENRQVFDETFVGHHPSLAQRDSTVYHVSYTEFCDELLCAMSKFLKTIDRSRKYELWIPCFSEQGFCFGKSNVWVSFLALPRLASVLSRVRIINFEGLTLDEVNGELGKTFQIPTDIILIDDGIYSGKQFNLLLNKMRCAFPLYDSDVHLHLIVPFITPEFLYKTSVDYYGLRDKLVLDKVCHSPTEKTNLEIRLYNEAVNDFRSKTLYNEEKVRKILTELYPISSEEDQDNIEAIIRYFNDTSNKSKINEDQWKLEHFHVHSTTLMDYNWKDRQTNFYFDHKIPDRHSSSVQRKFPDYQIVPPYKRHTWRFGGQPVYDGIFNSLPENKAGADALEYLIKRGSVV